MGLVWQNPIQRTVGTAHLSVTVCLWLFTASVHNTTQNSSDNLPFYFQTTIIAQMLSVGGEGGSVCVCGLLWLTVCLCVVQYKRTGCVLVSAVMMAAGVQPTLSACVVRTGVWTVSAACLHATRCPTSTSRVEIRVHVVTGNVKDALMRSVSSLSLQQTYTL